MRNRVGLGTYPLSISSQLSKDQACEIVKKFISEGGYYIDTAPLYGFGKAELILGEVFKHFKRQDFFIASKCGYVGVEGVSFQTIKKGSRYKDVIRECDNTLKRLDLDYLDLYFTHFADPKTPFAETISALIKLQEEGKIKEIGVSNVTLEQLREYNATGNIKYVQNRFSFLNQSLGEDFKKYLIENKIGLVPYNVIDRGLLTGRVFERNYDFQHGDLSVGLWNSHELEKIAGIVREKMSPIAKRLGITIGQLAIAWALQQKYVSFVLVGLTNPQYLPINLQAGNIKLSLSVMNELNSLRTDN